MTKYAKYIDKAKKLGARDVKVISSESVVTSEWVRLKCQFGCNGYGRTLTCPPYSPTPEQTEKVLKNYTRTLLIHGDQYTNIREIVASLEREIFLDGYWKAFAMGAGPCNLCTECGEYCTYPEKARPSMEACGIDVYSTVLANGFPIEVLRSGSCKANYYGIVLIE